MVDPGRLAGATVRLAWWVSQTLIGMAIVLSVLLKPTQTVVKDRAPGERTMVSGLKDGRARIALKVAEDEKVSTFLLQDGDGRDLMLIHLYTNGDYNFDFGDHLAARVSGGVQRARGTVLLGIGNDTTRTEQIAELDGTSTLAVRHRAGPKGPWVCLTPEGPQP
jgi:hypothetical protein